MIFSGFKVIEAARDILHKKSTFRNVYGSHTDIVKFDTLNSVTCVGGFVQQL